MDNSNLNTVLREYTYNHRLYNENIGRIISLIENNRSQTTQNRYFTSNRTSRSYNRPTLQEQILFFLNSASAASAASTNTTTQDRPTQRQIQDATENLNYYSDLGHTICPISLETFQYQEPITRIRHCGHIFRQECLRRWFENHSVCPVCRHNITTRQTTIENDTSPPTRNTRQNTSYSFLSQLLQSVMDLSGSGSRYTSSIGNTGDLLYEISIPLFQSENGPDTEDTTEFDDIDDPVQSQ